eukprot:gene18098-28067_t
MAGLTNRDSPYLWLNASSESTQAGVPVMWPYPTADAH